MNDFDPSGFRMFRLSAAILFAGVSFALMCSAMRAVRIDSSDANVVFWACVSSFALDIVALLALDSVTDYIRSIVREELEKRK